MQLAAEARREEQVQLGLLRATEAGALAAVAELRMGHKVRGREGARQLTERVGGAEALETRAATVAAAATAERERQLQVQRRRAAGELEAERRREAEEEARQRSLTLAEARRRDAASRRATDIARRRDRAAEVHSSRAAQVEAEAERRLRGYGEHTAAGVVQALALAARQRPDAPPSPAAWLPTASSASPVRHASSPKQAGRAPVGWDKQADAP
eukprot:scaffold24116_cov51-Isochrysis_galbana.AAC.1